MVKQKWIAGVLFLNLFGFYVFASENESNHWKKTGLRYRELVESGLFNDESCFENGEALRTCVTVVNYLGKQSKPKYQIQLRTEENLKLSLREVDETSPEVVSSIDIEFEKLSLIPPKERKAKIFQIKLAAHKEIIDLSEAIISNRDKYVFATSLTKNNQSEFFIPEAQVFEKLITEIISKIPKNEHQELLVGKAYNLYFSLSSDPHSAFLPSAEIEESTSVAREGTGIVGIGVILTKKGNQVFIKDLMSDSPAIRAGLKRGDILTKVGGVVASEEPFEELIVRLRGPKGSIVDIEVLRNKEILDFLVTRQEVVLKNVNGSVVDDLKKKIGYISIESFMDDNLGAKVAKEIQTLQNLKVEGLIIDLRNNGGGLLNSAIDLGALFVGKNPIVSLVNRETQSRVNFSSQDFDKITKLPLVVLVNEGSASASEVFSGAIQDYGRGWIVGVRTFGKGTAQELLSLKDNPELTLKHTSDFFYHPSGKTNQLVGIMPEFEVWSKPGETEGDHPEILREEDLYLNALEASSIAPILSAAYLETKEKVRDHSKQKIKNCIDKNQRAGRHFSDQLEGVSDYQLLYAQEILLCHNASKKWF